MRTAILLSTPVDPALRGEVQAGKHPLTDYLALSNALGATLIAPVKKRKKGRLPRLPLSKFWGFLRVAWAGFRVRNEVDVIVSDLDRVGVILALMLKLSRSKTQHVVICHGKIVGHPLDRNVVRLLRLHTHIHRFVCYGPMVAEDLRRALNLSQKQVVCLWHAVDHRFWSPQNTPTEKLIVSAGMEERDYETLTEAARGLDIKISIAAASPWVTSTKRGVAAVDLPPNVSVSRYSYQDLRKLYDKALMVAIPLRASRFQSGSLVAYEAMAMGKAVVMTATEGQKQLKMIEPGKSGFYVEEGDVKRWREIILDFCAHPEKAVEMGRQARERVEQELNLEAFTKDFAAVVDTLAADVRSEGMLRGRERVGSKKAV